ncbi:CAAX metallo endopeptidase, putative [Babesia bigemina]|uniref:CAAX prenyl protease n=1 Tax=Babesia bigemina TaxID=5866 RepID=A0A061DE19_BABBI|nr:CAAX metallo endopeptidase, putative [Babesia bigemina]CDR97884.1 CAAX metallo endopeptidase, putative [Babesia bigemina]|eukprot:XP_012770070.1 CAAX metallo endopeptidase, putative [Babesia bigemina]
MGIHNLFHSPFHFEFYLGALVINEFFEHYLNIRQLCVINKELRLARDPNRKGESGDDSDEIRKKAQQHVDVYLLSEDYHKTVEYARDKLVFQIISSVLQTVVSLILLFTFFGPKLWRFSGSLLSKPSETYQSLIFCGIKLLIDTTLDIPFGLYADFVLEEKHGFNKKTLRLFFKDLAISLVLQCVIGAPVLSIVIFLVHWGGDLFYIYVCIFAAIFYLFMLIIYPDLIAPLFNKFEPLNDDELKKGIEDLAGKLRFPLREIKLMDGSKRSNHSNMYFYGMWWFKKIVMYDTLLKQPKSQIIAITSHEMGHWKYNHVTKMLVFSLSQLFAIFYLFKLYKDDASMFRSFGYDGERAFIVGITLFGCVYTPLGALMHIIGTTITRYGEYQADNFAVKMGYGEELAKALVEIHHNNKSMIHHDPLYSWYHFTHPVLFERVYAIYKAMADMKL